MKRGINGDTTIKVARSEGGVDQYCKVGVFSTGWSFWPFQLHYGGAGYEHYGTVAGMGNGFTKLTGWQPETDPPWRDSIRYALNRAKTGGWSSWYGAAAVGIGQWEGIDRSFSWDGSSERWDYERTTADSLTYNPAQPPERQVQSWVCSIRATAWMLKSLGLPVDIGALQDEMTPRYVTPSLGLLDGRGYGLAEVLTAHLPASWASRVEITERATWHDIWSRSGRGPMAVGLHGAYHWLNVAAPQADGTVISPNPAPKYPSAAPIGDVLTADEVQHFGPSSLVWIDAKPRPDQPVTPPPTDAYKPWRGHVGDGLLAMMAADNTFPAQRASTWLPLGANPADIEACIGQNGISYQWILASQHGFRHVPAS